LSYKTDKFDLSDIRAGKLVRNMRTNSIGLILSADRESQYFKVLTNGKSGLEVYDWFRSNLEEINHDGTQRASSRYFS